MLGESRNQSSSKSIGPVVHFRFSVLGFLILTFPMVFCKHACSLALSRDAVVEPLIIHLNMMCIEYFWADPSNPVVTSVDVNIYNIFNICI